MNEELKSRIELCARMLKATGGGQVIVDATIIPTRYVVHRCGRSRLFYTLEELEEFAEGMFEGRRTPSAKEVNRRRRYLAYHSLSHAV